MLEARGNLIVKIATEQLCSYDIHIDVVLVWLQKSILLVLVLFRGAFL